MTIRKALLVLGLAGALGIAIVAGTAFAQTPTPTPGQAKTNYHQFFLDRLAAALGITGDKLTAALTQARNDTVDQEVKDGRLTQQQADSIKSRPGTAPFGFGPAGRGPKGGAHFPGGGKVFDAVAQALGMTTQDLTTQLRSGKTLADLAKGKEQAVKDAIVNAEKPQLDQAVKNGRITQDRENQILDQIRNSDLSKFNFHRGIGWKGQGNPGPAFGRPSSGPAPSGTGAL